MIVVVSDFISRRVVIWTDCSWRTVVDCAGWMFVYRWMWVCPSSFVGATSKYFRAQRAALDFYAHINHAFRLSFQCLSCPAPLGLLWSMFGGRECVFECGLSRCRLNCIALNRIFYVTQKKKTGHLSGWRDARPFRSRNALQAKHTQLLLQPCLLRSKPSIH